MSFDPESLLQDILPDAPCGENLEYDPAFAELERLVRGTPETQFRAAEEPDWKAVRDQALELCGRTRDLRVLLYLLSALVRLDGVSGLRDGLALLRGALDRYWETVHPQLDPDDGSDPLERLNALAALAPPTGGFEDRMKLRDAILDAPLCASRQIGRFGLRHLLVARGELSAPPPKPGETRPDASLIAAAFEDSDINELHTCEGALQQALEQVSGIDACLTRLVGVGRTVNLDPLKQTVKQALAEVSQALGRRGYASAAVEGAAPAAGASPAAGGSTAAAPGEIASLDDVRRAFDKICQYYERQEPSSPVPLLVKRARRLVGKSFLDIVRDITPGAMSQVEVISGAPPPEGT